MLLPTKRQFVNSKRLGRRRPPLSNSQPSNSPQPSKPKRQPRPPRPKAYKPQFGRWKVPKGVRVVASALVDGGE